MQERKEGKAGEKIRRAWKMLKLWQ